MLMLRRLSRMFHPVFTNMASARHCGGGGAFDKNCVSIESKISEVLKQSLPGLTYISVHDISGGCGAMFEISIEAKEFEGLSVVKQHRLVTDCLKQEIKQMHGVRIHTAAPTHMSK